MVEAGETPSGFCDGPTIEIAAPLEHAQDGLQLSDEVLLGQELGERRADEGVRRLSVVPAHEVHGEVVGGPERRGEGPGAAAGDPGDVGETVEGRAQHGRIAHVVDAPPAGATGELGVLARCQLLVAPAAELGDLLDYHRAGGHVDPEGQRLGGEHHLYERLGEARLDGFAERRHHARMVGSHAGFHALLVRRIAENRQVLVGEGIHVGLHDRPDPMPLLGRCQPEAVVEAVPHRLVAAGPREHEVDRRQRLSAARPSTTSARLGRYSWARPARAARRESPWRSGESDRARSSLSAGARAERAGCRA